MEVSQNKFQHFDPIIKVQLIQRNQSNVRKYHSTNKRCDKTVIGKDSSGRPIHLMFVNDKITIDFIENKQKNYQRQRISIEDEDQTKCWLKRINFHNYLSITNTDLMEDPFRNGVLFWELIWFLENIQLYDVFYTPKVMKDWRDNIDKFFSVWHQIDRLRENMSPSLLSNKELILKGDQATIWGILNWLKKLYPDFFLEKILLILRTLYLTQRKN